MYLKLYSIDPNGALAAIDFCEPHPDECERSRNFSNTSTACESYVDLLSTYNTLYKNPQIL